MRKVIKKKVTPDKKKTVSVQAAIDKIWKKKPRVKRTPERRLALWGSQVDVWQERVKKINEKILVVEAKMEKMTRKIESGD